jgi:hypothetical protein
VSGTEGLATPFRALLAAALNHHDAALGLACAYAELPASERARLLDAVVADAHEDALALTPLLGPLCALETDPALSARLRGLLEAHGVALFVPERMSKLPPRILLAGDSSSGAALLVRPIDERQAHALELCWNTSQLSLEVAQKRVPAHELPALAAALRDRLKRHARATLPEIEEIPLDLAAEVIAEALWRHRRANGVLPAELNDFADMIGPHNGRARA